MAQTTPNMNLRTWDLLTDNFSHADLRANWLAVDQHDHTPGKGSQVGPGGLASLSVITDSLADQAVTQTKIGDLAVGSSQLAAGAVTTSKLAAGAVTDTQLVSPNNVTYKQIMTASAFAAGSTFTSGSTYVLMANGSFQVVGSHNAAMAMYYLDPADYTAGSKANKYRLKVATLTNATPPLSTLTFGLYPVTAVAGGAGVIVETLGAVTVGSTIPFVVGPSVRIQANSGDFAAPVAGYYVFGCAVTVATQAANSALSAHMILQQRQV